MWFSPWILPQLPAARPVIGPDCLLASLMQLAGDVQPPAPAPFSQWFPAPVELRSSHLIDEKIVTMIGLLQFMP